MDKTDEELLAELRMIFAEVLDSPGLTLSCQTTAADLDEWDSLAHIQLALAVGKHFNVKFSTEEIISWTSVGAIVDTLRKHL